MVVNSTPDKGGTWNGAIEDLKSDWVPLWVRPKNSPHSGNSALVQKGARWFPNEMPALSSLLVMAFNGDVATEGVGLPLHQSETESALAETDTKTTYEGNEGGLAVTPPVGKPAASSDLDVKSLEPVIDFYPLFLRRLLLLTGGDPLTAEDIAARLELEKAQVNAWLKRGVTDGQIKKLNKPVRYQSASAQQRQASFF